MRYLPWLLILIFVMIIVVSYRRKKRGKKSSTESSSKTAENKITTDLMVSYEEFVENQLRIINSDLGIKQAIQLKANQNNKTFEEQQFIEIAKGVEANKNTIPDNIKIPQKLINLYR